MSEVKYEKIVYFVRHGETVSNVSGVVQGLKDPLSEVGEKQAQMIAERTKHISFDALLSSDAVRAHETAKKISNVTGHDVELNDLLREVRRPDSFIGLPRDTEEYKNFLITERDRFGKNWHFEDEENYDDILKRTEAVIEVLESRVETSILAVTHGHFLRFLACYLLIRREITPEIWNKISHTLFTSNTGVTVCTYNDGLWQLLTWNDHAHLAE